MGRVAWDDNSRKAKSLEGSQGNLVVIAIACT